MNDDTVAKITQSAAFHAGKGDLQGAVLYMLTGIYQELKAIREVLSNER